MAGRARAITVFLVRKAVIIALVLLVVVTGIPLAFGMSSMVACADCGPARLATTGACLIVLATGLMLVFASMVSWLRVVGAVVSGQLVPRPLEHPPRVA